MREGIYLLFLSVCSWQDWRKREIRVWLLVLFVLCGLAAAFQRRGFCFLVLFDLLPGLLLFLTSLLSRGAVGLGDAWALTASGLFLGGMAAGAELFLGLILAAFWGCLEIVRKRISRKSRLPFLPFLWLSSCVFLILQYGESVGTGIG